MQKIVRGPAWTVLGLLGMLLGALDFVWLVGMLCRVTGRSAPTSALIVPGVSLAVLIVLELLWFGAMIKWDSGRTE